MIKGPFYPIFIAAAYWLNVPLLSAQQILYWLASCVAIWAIYPAVRRKWLLPLLFLFLLFNPFSFNYPWVGRAYRLGIYPSLGILVFSCIAGFSVRLNTSWKKALIWSVAAGIFLSAFWNTREESVWIVPSLLLLFMPIFLRICLVKRSQAFGLLGLSFLPLLIFLSVNYTLKTVNLRHYGVFSSIELKTPEFKSAYGGLLRIESKYWRQHYPVVKDVREKAYAVSPSFRELKPYLEGSVGKSWQSLSGGDDFSAAHFIWAFRDSVAYAGYADKGTTALKFYERMGGEIDQACETGRLDCRSRITALIPSWHKEYNELILPTFFSVMKQLITFQDFSASTDGMMSFGPREIMITYETVTREKILTSRRDRLRADPGYHRQVNRKKIDILNKIGKFYQTTTPPCFLLALLMFTFSVVRSLISKQYSFFTLLGGAALAGLLSIVFILTLLTITSYSEIERPLHTAYPLLLIFIMTVFVDITQKSILK